MRVYLIGFMGAGKTHWGKKLSQKMQLPFFDLDDEVQQYASMSIAEIFANDGEEYFRELEANVLRSITDLQKGFVMSCGGGTPCYFKNIDLMKSKGVVVWLNTPTDMLMNRLMLEKDKRPLIRDLSEEQLKSFIIKKMADRSIYYEQAALKVDESQINLDELIKSILHV
jgi:shikimate kinase